MDPDKIYTARQIFSINCQRIVLDFIHGSNNAAMYINQIDFLDRNFVR